MDKIIVTVIGKDRPGIIAAVSKSLYLMGCNLQNVNQMILQNQFAGFFVVELPLNLTIEAILKQLEDDLKGLNLKVHADRVEDANHSNSDKALKNAKSSNGCDIFFITTIGPDQKGLVARFTEIIASYSVNIVNLTAIFKGGDDPTANIMCYQVEIKPDTDQSGLFKSIRDKASELGLDISIQHKNIFETINKI
ncbi:MAG: amino acid-binding protein [Desulfamplus sp.]|nr:amino acid-binding protein [Desulfamplus sp.]MBF0389870.1 amino acid-binding protein [Desulfamplus sp.]